MLIDLESVGMVEAINGSVRTAVGDGVMVFEGSARAVPSLELQSLGRIGQVR